MYVQVTRRRGLCRERTRAGVAGGGRRGRRGGRAGAVGGKMGVGSVINLMIVASMVYRMGGSPWSLQTALVNAKQNPVQVMLCHA